MKLQRPRKMEDIGIFRFRYTHITIVLIACSLYL